MKDGAAHAIDCDFIAGCDGYHGVSRASVAAARLVDLREGLPVRLARRARRYAAGLARMIYSNHERGFALCSMRLADAHRYYIQCPSHDKVGGSGATTRSGDELRRRLDREAAKRW
jgi:p-hydroxybenzoate 3-monooxygenase